MVSIQIKQGQGISQAIKATLVNRGVDTSSMNASVWNNILTEVSNDNDNNKKNSKAGLFQGGNDVKGDYRKNFVVKPNQTITIDDASWNKIVSFTSKTSETGFKTSETVDNPIKKTERNFKTSETVDNPIVKSAEDACADDITALKTSGVKVSNWENGKCTLAYKGKTATITIDKNGNTSFGGDINFMMDHLQSSSSAEQTSVNNQDAFLAKMKKDGYSVQANSKFANIKVNGKEVSAVKYVFNKNGQSYVAYLNGNGQQVRADK